MKTRSFHALVAVAFTLAIAAPSLEAAAAAPASPPPPETPFIAKMLPVAAGALVGAATGFFILPLLAPGILAPGVAAGVIAGPPTSPLFGVAGAGMGALIGNQIAQ